MALVIVSGLPCSGRTARSKELLEDFGTRISGHGSIQESQSTDGSEQKNNSINTGNLSRLVHLRNEDANVDRHAFAQQITEKPSRAAYLSLVMRNLSRDAIVVADGGAGTNIKGFRYQLYCAAREVGVRCVSVLCVARPEVCKDRNDERIKKGEGRGDAYEEEVLDELLMRFEEPNPMTRWDSPLFVLDCNPKTTSDGKGDAGGPSAKSADWEKAPLDAIWQAATTGRVTKAPDVVAPVRGTSGNYLSMLESTTQTVLSTLQSLASSGVVSNMGGQVQLPLPLASEAGGQTKVSLSLPPGKGPPSTATLQRLRRQFIKMHASGAAAQNEIGLVMGDEGGKGRRQRQEANGAGTGSSRAERKVQQFESQEKRQIDAKRRPDARDGGSASDRAADSPELVIARRFAAYLEETL